MAGEVRRRRGSGREAGRRGPPEAEFGAGDGPPRSPGAEVRGWGRADVFRRRPGPGRGSGRRGPGRGGGDTREASRRTPCAGAAIRARKHDAAAEELRRGCAGDPVARGARGHCLVQPPPSPAPASPPEEVAPRRERGKGRRGADGAAPGPVRDERRRRLWGAGGPETPEEDTDLRARDPARKAVPPTLAKFRGKRGRQVTLSPFRPDSTPPAPRTALAPRLRPSCRGHGAPRIPRTRRRERRASAPPRRPPAPRLRSSHRGRRPPRIPRTRRRAHRSKIVPPEVPRAADNRPRTRSRARAPTTPREVRPGLRAR